MQTFNDLKAQVSSALNKLKHLNTHQPIKHQELKSLLKEECYNLNKYNNNTDIDKNSSNYHKYHNIGAFVLIIMSHGGKDHVYGTDGSKNRNNVNITEIVELFNGENCSALVDKPKLFFVQACQAGWWCLLI